MTDIKIAYIIFTLLFTAPIFLFVAGLYLYRAFLSVASWFAGFSRWWIDGIREDNKALRNENKALRGQLKYARRQADPVKAVNNRFIASLQAKLHEHKLAYQGIQKLLADVAKERDELKTELQDKQNAASITEAFYALTLQQRNDAWREIETLKRSISDLEAKS